MSQEPHPNLSGQSHGRAMLIIFWLLVLGALTYFFGTWEEHQYNPNQNLNSDTQQGVRQVVLERNRYHHYVASGLINGTAVTFMLDTGATAVVIPANLANKLQLKAGRPHIANTANGQVEVRATRIDTLELGAIKLHNINASINPGMDGEEILLGMSALKQIEFSQKGKVLTLRQYH